jgi:hypothetical protein
MSIIKAVVQSPTNISFSDGDDVNLIAGKQAELLVAAAHTELYSQTYRGNTYHASTTPLGLAIPIYTSTAPLVVLWNPIGSGKNLSIQNVVFAYTSGTAGYGAVGLMLETGVGSTIATGAVFSAFAGTTPTNGLVGGGNTSVAKVSISGTNTLTTAGAAGRWFYTLGNINLEAATGTAHATFTPGAGAQIKGSIILAPGSAMWIACTVASSALYAQTISWAEVPT